MRKAATAFVVAALILLLCDLPKQVVVADPPPPPAPTTSGPCDDIWAVPGFETRFMVYDPVVHQEQRFGPEVKGKVVSDAQDELQQRLCVDDALLFDLSTYDRNGFNSVPTKADRLDGIAAVANLTLEDRNLVVQQLLDMVLNGNPKMEMPNSAFASWYHRAGGSDEEVPILGVVNSEPQRSTLLVYQAESGMRYLRLECGFQPTQL